MPDAVLPARPATDKTSCCTPATSKTTITAAPTTITAAPSQGPADAPIDPHRLLELAPDVHRRFRAYIDEVRADGPLSAECRAAVTLGAALAAGNDAVVRRYVAMAKRSGLSNEEIGHAAALVDVLRLETRQATPSAAAAPAKPKSNSCC